MGKFWEPSDIIAWRGIYRDKIWHAQTVIVVKDSPEEIVLTLLPGAECCADENYPRGKSHSKRRWQFKDMDWKLEKYIWRTNRLLLIFEPEKYYSTIYFWNHASNEFLCYYINFQLPFERSHCGVDTLDLDLDLIIYPNYTYEWKDENDYQQAIEHGVILPEWTRQINSAKEEVLGKLETRQYPINGSWLDWIPDATWSPPKLPQNWDKI
jgi:protein associated with RNAse G/E